MKTTTANEWAARMFPEDDEGAKEQLLNIESIQLESRESAFREAMQIAENHTNWKQHPKYRKAASDIYQAIIARLHASNHE